MALMIFEASLFFSGDYFLRSLCFCSFQIPMNISSGSMVMGNILAPIDAMPVLSVTMSLAGRQAIFYSFFLTCRELQRNGGRGGRGGCDCFGLKGRKKVVRFLIFYPIGNLTEKMVKKKMFVLGCASL